MFRVRNSNPPPCECFECSQQYRPMKLQENVPFRYSATRGEDDAQALLREEVDSIRAGQAYVRGTLAKHGNTILGRWKKKSVAKRVEFLKDTFPGMEQNKRSHFEYMYNLNLPKNENEYRNAFLLPYLSLEDLKVDPMGLLSLLHYRTDHDIEEWVLFDIKQTKSGYDTGRFAPEYCPSCVVTHGREYGNLVPWDKTESHRWDTIGYPRAQLVIEAQRILLRFLRNTVEHLLHGVEIESLSTKWTEVCSSGFRKSREDETWSPFINQAYASPPTFSIDRLLEVSRARLASAEDHLWLLQTDPSYMHATIAYHRHSRLRTLLRNESEAKLVYG